jgi:hypothetical protein
MQGARPIVSGHMERIQVSGTAGPDEAAAIAAAIARFQAETAPAQAPEAEAVGAWQRAALAEGVGAKATLQRHLEGGDRWLS